MLRKQTNPRKEAKCSLSLFFNPWHLFRHFPMCWIWMERRCWWRCHRCWRLWFCCPLYCSPLPRLSFSGLGGRVVGCSMSEGGGVLLPLIVPSSALWVYGCWLVADAIIHPCCLHLLLLSHPLSLASALFNASFCVFVPLNVT